MSTARTVFAGMLALALLDTAISSQAAANRTGALFTSVSAVFAHLLSPTVPAIPDLRKHGGASTPSTDTAPAADTPSSLLPADWTTSPTAASLEA